MGERLRSDALQSIAWDDIPDTGKGKVRLARYLVVRDLLTCYSSAAVDNSMSPMNLPEAHHQDIDYLFITCHCRYKYDCRRHSIIISTSPQVDFGAPHSEILVLFAPILYRLYLMYSNNDTYVRLLAALAAPFDTLGYLVSHHWAWNSK